MYNSTKKLNLRRLKQEDLYPTFEARNDPDVYRWCRQAAPLHWNNHLAWYAWQASEPSVDMFVLENSSGFVGVCGLTSIDLVNSRAEFSLYIHPKRQKSGLGEEGLVLLLDYGFSVLGLNRIWGEVFSTNEKAMHIFNKLGFLLEGTRREFYFRDGNFIDSHLISMDRASFYNTLGIEKNGKVSKRSGPKPRARVVDFTKVRTLPKETRSRGDI